MKPVMNTRLLLILSRIFFFLGVVIGLVLAVIAIWNNTEATSYYYTGVAYPLFHGLRCPVMISPTEKGIVTAVFDNPTTKEDIYYYRIQISRSTSSTRTIEAQIAAPPRQSTSVQWTVDANDVDLGFFILVKITILPSVFHPTQEAVCGIIVANIFGLTGSQIFATALFLSFLGIAVGLGLWQQTGTNANRDLWRLAQALGLVVMLALLATSMGWWAVAIALSVITILLLVISIRFTID
jgi:hypothetical protein